MDAVVELNTDDVSQLLTIRFGGARMQYTRLHVPRQKSCPWSDPFWSRMLSNLEKMLCNQLNRSSHRFSMVSGESSPAELLDHFEDLVTEAGTADYVTDRLTADAKRTLSRFGMTFDLQSLTLNMRDRSERLPPVCARLLMFFLNSRNGETAQNLGIIWQDIGTKKIKNDAVRQAINDLNKRLYGFPFTITSYPDKRYRLSAVGIGDHIGIS